MSFFKHAEARDIVTKARGQEPHVTRSADLS